MNICLRPVLLVSVGAIIASWLVAACGSDSNSLLSGSRSGDGGPGAGGGVAIGPDGSAAGGSGSEADASTGAGGANATGGNNGTGGASKACTGDGSCAAPTPYCDSASGTCVECRGDANCSTGTRRACNTKTFTCVRCTADASCTDGGVDAGAPADGGVDGATDGAADGAADGAPQDAASSDAASSDAGGFESDFVTSCLAGLEVQSGGDAVHVEGKAGSVGDVNYTIWGYSGGNYSGSGFGLVANSAYGQAGTPLGIQNSGVVFSVRDGAVQTGVTYRADSLLSGSGPYMEIEIIPAASTPFTNCDQDGSGMIRFTRYEGITHDHPVVGVYEFRCVSASVAVRGCFRFSGT